MKLRVSPHLLGFCVIGAVLAACHDSPPPQQARGPAPQAEPVVVTKAEPPPYCRPLGMVKGKADDWYFELRQQASDQGANVVVLDAAESTNVGFWGRIGTEIIGRSFFCPPPPRYPPPQAAYPVATARPPTAPPPTAAQPPPAAPQPAASSSCQPPCSPGYACEQGKCVPLCNPKCGPNQYCAADRTCRAAR